MPVRLGGQAVALTSATGTLAANTSAGLSGSFADIMSTSSLAVGTWQVTWTATILGGTLGAACTMQSVAGTATVTPGGPTALGVGVAASTLSPATLTVVVTVTAAGTLKLQASVGSTNNVTFQKNPNVGGAAATGYTAVRIA